jgi:hypothetical protein
MDSTDRKDDKAAEMPEHPEMWRLERSEDHGTRVCYNKGQFMRQNMDLRHRRW